MLDMGAYAELYADRQLWGGRSGRSLSTLGGTADKFRRPTPIWLLDLLDATCAASEADREAVRGTSCRRFTVRVDVDRVSAAFTADWLDDPDAPQLEAWIDGDHLRRVRAYVEHRTQTLELWDIGTPVDDLDWTRLPIFRPHG